MKTRVSVVIPCYNEERRLPACLGALKKQTAVPYEIIVVDNNSTDSSIEIAKSFGVKVVHEKQQGIGFARNKGFNEATGDVIARIDADSVADVHWVQAIAETMEDKKVVATGGVSYTYELRWIRPVANAVHASFNRMHERRMSGLRILYGFNLAVRSTVWKKLATKLDATSLNEDIDFSLLVRNYGEVTRSRNMVVGNRLAGFVKPKKMWRYWLADGKIAKRLRREMKAQS